jgi:ABC-type spermidine/putrescine transport system permease subunit II
MRRNRVLLGVYVWGLLSCLVAPILVVVGIAFNPTPRFRLPMMGISLRWFREFFGSGEYLHALFAVSLPLAFVVCLTSVLIGTLAAIGLVRFRIRGREVVETVFLLPILVPSILLGASLYLFFVRINLAGSFTALAIGHTLVGIPFVIRVVIAGLTAVNPAYEEAAISLGCSRVRAFWKVVMPLLRSSMISGGVFAFIASFSDVNVALFLSGPGTNTLPLQIFSDIQWQGDPSIAAASAIQVLVVTALVLAAQFLSRARAVV